jgi:hypothetical protein
MSIILRIELKFIFLVLMSVYLTSCSTIVYMPITTHQTPEVSGELWNGEVGLNFATTVGVEVVNNNDTNPPTRNEIEIGVEGLFGNGLLTGTVFDFSLGLWSKIDFYINRYVGAKFQFLGEPRKAGWVGSAFLGGATGSAASTSTSSDDTSDAVVSVNGNEGGVSIGFRKDEGLMYYGTLAHRIGTADIVVDQTAEDFEYEDNYTQSFATIGVLVGAAFYGKFEASYTTITWKGESDNLGKTISDTGAGGGVSLGFGYRW